MKVDYPTIQQPASPGYVLAVLRDQHRQQCQYDPEAEPTKLSFASSVAEWRQACDLVEWRQLGRALNDRWGVQVSEEEWHRVLEPSASRNLGGVCEFLASRANRPAVRPVRLLGIRCRTAGIFLTIRSLLHDAGAEVGDLRPSTPLQMYARRFPHVFLTAVSALAPGNLPPVRILTPVYDAAAWIASIGLVVAGIGLWMDSTAVVAVGALAGMGGHLLAWMAVRCLRPAQVRFGKLRTFRDLTEAISFGNRT